jgi:hypothetical protein
MPDSTAARNEELEHATCPASVRQPGWPPVTVPFRREGIVPTIDSAKRHLLRVRIYELEEEAAVLRAQLRAGGRR